VSAPFDPTRHDVVAPIDVVGWSVSRGWITDRSDLLAAHDDADAPIYAVPADRIVRDVVGTATTAALMHLDTRVLAARRECDELRARGGS
jgi:hypothetical protein